MNYEQYSNRKERILNHLKIDEKDITENVNTLFSTKIPRNYIR